MVEGLSPDDAQRGDITTVSLLDLVRERMPRDADDALVFVKLDLEEWRSGAGHHRSRRKHGEFVILYEDHGSNTTNLTAFMLERGFNISFMADDGTLEPIQRTSLHRLDALKANPSTWLQHAAVRHGGRSVPFGPTLSSALGPAKL